ncbi:AraC family transcriptional regulator [Chishuiella sp.]|uniref:AraC family transcriptional regulator n=1 Tax=Chishuiella sp. TaxID=1969467 RepID=UPI0028A90D5E|nr:AraC family transcriptional regulator [Chishuiella sp.]
MDNLEINYEIKQPDESISDFVESFWFIKNNSSKDKEIVIMPDGRVDFTISRSSKDNFRIVRSGLETYPQTVTLQANTIIFAISFKLLSIEYIFHDSIANIIDDATYLPVNFWNFKEEDLNDFNSFCKKSISKIKEHLPEKIDNRKEKLFKLIYDNNGEISIKELSEEVSWSERQINRYFNQRFGISLKKYNKILRFKASFEHIKKGKLFPQQNFTDQSHFIKEVKKLAGVSPKELKKNENDRFIQFSVIPLK